MSGLSKVRDITKYKKSQIYNKSEPMSGDQASHFLDLAAVAPSPSRDYYRIYVTGSEVTLTQWRISHGPRSVPLEQKVPLEMFQKDLRMPSEVSRVFGKDCVDYITGLGHGHIDKIMHLPIQLLAKIFHYIGIEHLKRVAPVCSKFAQVCRSDELWKRFYLQYGGFDAAIFDTKQNAEYLSWKSLFFIDRLHYKIGNADRFGFFSEHHMNIISNNRHLIEGHSSNTSIDSSSTHQSEGRITTKMISSGTRESSSSSRALMNRRTTRIVDALVPRASAPKINNNIKKEIDKSPRQKATRYTLVQENTRKNPSTSASASTRKYNI